MKNSHLSVMCLYICIGAWLSANVRSQDIPNAPTERRACKPLHFKDCPGAKRRK